MRIWNWITSRFRGREIPVEPKKPKHYFQIYAGTPKDDVYLEGQSLVFGINESCTVKAVTIICDGTVLMVLPLKAQMPVTSGDNIEFDLQSYLKVYGHMLDNVREAQALLKQVKFCL